MAEISVLTPTYNCAKYLKRCLDSLACQTYSDFEVIIVDDGSTDETEQIISDYRKTSKLQISYIKQENRGIAKTRNVALSKAKGKWIAWIDADDAWKPEKLEKQINFLKANPEYSAVFCKTWNVIDREELKSDPKALAIVEYTNRMTFFLPSALLSKELYDKYGFYDETQKYDEDTEWLIRFFQGGEKSHCLEDILYVRYLHGNNITIENPQTREQLMRLFAKGIRRHNRILKHGK